MKKKNKKIQKRCLNCKLTCKQPMTVKIIKCNYTPINNGK